MNPAPPFAIFRRSSGGRTILEFLALGSEKTTVHSGMAVSWAPDLKEEAVRRFS
jgi:hypothetical protein